MAICDKLTAKAKAQMKEEIFLSATYRSERHIGFDKEYNPVKTKQVFADGKNVVSYVKPGSLLGDFHVHPLVLYDKRGGMFFYENTFKGDFEKNMLEPDGVDVHTNLLRGLMFSCIGTFHPRQKEYIAQCYEINLDNKKAQTTLNKKLEEMAYFLPEDLQKEMASKRKLTPPMQKYIIGHRKDNNLFNEYCIDLFGLMGQFIKNRCSITLGRGKTNRWELEVNWGDVFSNRHHKFREPEW